MSKSLCVLGASALLLAGPALGAAPPASQPEPLGAVRTLPAASPHWMWINDITFPHMNDGQALLVDGDSGRLLGLLSTGFGFVRLNIPRDGSVLYSPETYFSRGTRGTRTDVVTLYDPHTLRATGEIVIPPKRSSNMPMMANSQLTDDDRFLLIYNFNPAQSVSVVDTRSRRFAGEIETAGCALIYPTGPRSFFSLCADGALLEVRLTGEGRLAGQRRSAPVFDVEKDPVTEKAVRLGNSWLFVSFAGVIHPVVADASGLKAGPAWSLLSPEERKEGWRPGGLQQLAVHATLRRLYSIMHKGPVESHKDPGPEVWVYDLDRQVRVQKIALKRPAGAIQVTPDTKPLLFGISMDSTTTEIHDAVTGAPLRSIPDIGTTPSIMVTP